MNKSIKLVIALLCYSVFTCVAQTSVNDGNWSDPATWGGVPPVGTGNVSIHHNVILDIDYSHTAGDINISSGASLTGNSVNRIFALNYPVGTSQLTNYGIFNVSRVVLMSDTLYNYSNFYSDSILCYSVFENMSGGFFLSQQCWIDAPGQLYNYSSCVSSNFLNTGFVFNSLSQNTDNMTNSLNYTNNAGAVLVVNNDLSNIDSLSSPAILHNDGSIQVLHNFHNGNQMTGTGQFCVLNNSWNEGTLSGTFDFCDITGGVPDLNTGTISAGITICTFNCFASDKGKETNRAGARILDEGNSICFTGLQPGDRVDVYTITGQLIQSCRLNEELKVYLISDSALSSGLYIVHYYSMYEAGVFKLMRTNGGTD